MYKLATDRRIKMGSLFTGILLAALGLSLLFLMNGGLAQAQDNLRVVEYDEGGTEPVLTLSAEDPEGVTPVVWSLVTVATDFTGDGDNDVIDTEVADHARFKISQNGVLEFRAKPNFESPVPDGGDNTYKVVVQATDRGDMDHRNWFKVTVKVMDLEEAGKVTLSHTTPSVPLLQPQVGVQITAAVTDPDSTGTITGASDGGVPSGIITWKWYRSSSANGPWAVISGATEATYTPRDEAGNNDVGMHLRAEAKYTDRRDEYGDKKAEAVSAHPVSAARTNNTDPSFSQTTVSRTIPENTGSGMNIGAPVAAMDSDSGDIRVYTLAGDGASSFSIDNVRGQLKTKAKLDFETTPSYTVTVTATDSSGGQTSPVATVTISVGDVDEAPFIPTDNRAVAVTKKDIVENATDLMIGTYAWTDPEGAIVTLSLSGADASKFELADDTDAGPEASQVLSFRESPDFEARADSDSNNVYEVTVEASDGSKVGKRSVTVKVTNVEEVGKVTLSGARPVIGTEITATVVDEDGFVPDTVSWTWHRIEATNPTDDADDTNDILGKTKATYTPVTADKDMILKAKASYADMTYDMERTVTSDASVPVIVDPVNKQPVFNDGASTTRYVMEGTGVRLIVGLVDAEDANRDGLAYTLGGTDKDSFSILNGDDTTTNDVTEEAGQLRTKAKLDYEKKTRYTVTVTADDGRGETNSTATITVTIMVTNMDEKPTIVYKKDSLATETQVVEYDEDGTEPVLTLSAEDPEGVTPVVWSLVTVATDFTGDGDNDVIDTEVADHARFKISQNGVLEFRAKPNFESPVPDGGDNTYKVVVQATDRGDMDHRNWFKVTVKVMDLEEAGKVTLSHTTPSVPLLQPQVGVQITAAVTDPDSTGTITGASDGGVPSGIITWKWYRSSSANGPWAVISGATEATYTPRDEADNNDVGMHLRAEAKYTDRRDEYGDKKAESVSAHEVLAEVEDNTDPSFSQTTVSRTIPENTGSGMNIGAPVAAMDSDSGDIRVYTLAGDGASSFSIDNVRGQLKTKAKLDFETTPSYTVTVTATDSSGGQTSPVATVTISVGDVDEAPFIPTDNRAVAVTKKDIVENATDLMIGTYAWTDPEGAIVTLSLSGADASKFELADDTDAGPEASQVLSFRESPDFEARADSDSNNVYEVTVEASDGSKVGKRSVTVKVTNVEEVGKVTLSGARPVIGTEITATVVDEDGFVPDTVSWTWHRIEATNPTDDADDTNDIPGKTKATYTPVTADDGMILKAKASYADMTYDMERTVTSDASVPVIVDPVNKQPVFNDGASTTRYVMEGTGVRLIVGLVDAEDANRDGLAYTLGGTDKDSFSILNGDDTTTNDVTEEAGQLRTKAKLDYEKKTRYTVTVTADDGRGETNSTATITVTIMVTNMDEKPKITATEGGLAITGPGSVSIDEEGSTAVGTYTAEGATLTLSGADSSYFNFRSGELSFKSAPNYETKSTYRVTVTATDVDGMTVTRDVTVTVINKDEAGEVAAISGTASVDSVLTAGMVTDPDGSVSGEGWTWERSMDGTTWSAISGATSSTYTAVAGDVGYHLRVKVTYSDPQGSGKMATSAMTVKVVAADAGDPLVADLLDKFDDNENEQIDKSEVVEAIIAFVDPDASDKPSKEDIVNLIVHFVSQAAS